MQGLADGYFVLPYTIQNYLADEIATPRMTGNEKEFVEAEKTIAAKFEKLLAVKGQRSVDSFHVITSYSIHYTKLYDIELQHFKKVVDELSPYLIYLNLYVQGEPFMHPQFDVLVRYARSKSIYTSTSTNGHFINAVMAHKIVEAGLTRLIFSLDGITQQSYTKYRRGGDVEVVKQAIRDVVAAKKHHRKHFPLVIIQFLVFKHNEHEMDDLVLLANNLGVDKVEFKSAQFNDFGFGEVEEPENATYARYSNRMLKHPMRNRCWRMWQAPVVTWDGAVCPCCYDKDAEWSFGNAFQIPIAKLLHSPSYKEFASKVFVDKQQLNMCHNCPEGRGWF